MVKMFMLIAVSVALFCAYSITAQSQRPTPSSGILSSNKKPQTTEEKQNSKNGQRGTEQTPLVVKMAPSPNAQEEAAEAKKEKKDQAAANRRVEITTWVIAILTSIQAIALIWTVIVMIRTTQRQLRAYVFVKTIEIHNVANFIDKGKVIESNARLSRPYNGPMAFLTIMNYGKTPADKMTCWANIYIREYPLNSDLPMSQPIGEIYLQPGGQFHKNLMIIEPLTLEETNQLREGTSAIYVHGKITYTDIFDKSHHTTFRHYHNGLTGTIGIATGMVYCNEGNDYY